MCQASKFWLRFSRWVALWLLFEYFRVSCHHLVDAQCCLLHSFLGRVIFFEQVHATLFYHLNAQRIYLNRSLSVAVKLAMLFYQIDQFSFQAEVWRTDSLLLLLLLTNQFHPLGQHHKVLWEALLKSFEKSWVTFFTGLGADLYCFVKDLLLGSTAILKQLCGTLDQLTWVGQLDSLRMPGVLRKQHRWLVCEALVAYRLDKGSIVLPLREGEIHEPGRAGRLVHGWALLITVKRV